MNNITVSFLTLSWANAISCLESINTSKRIIHAYINEKLSRCRKTLKILDGMAGREQKILLIHVSKQIEASPWRVLEKHQGDARDKKAMKPQNFPN